MNLFKKYSYLPYLENYKAEKHIDSLLDKKDFKYINKKLNQVFNEVNKLIEKKFFDKKYNFLEINFKYFQSHKVVANLFHKLLILNKIYQENEYKKIDIDVTKEELNFYDKSGINGFSLNRFANLYAMLGIYIGEPFKINILDSSFVKKKFEYKPATKSKNIFLRYINYNYGILVNEFLERYNFLNYDKKIFTFIYSPLIKEILSELSKKKIGQLNIRNELAQIYFNNKSQESFQINEIYEAIFNILDENTKSLKDEFNISNQFFKGYLKILSDIASRNIHFLHNIKTNLRKKVAELKSNNSNSYPIFLSNGLFGSFGIACADALMENNIKIIACEHSNNGIHLNQIYALNFNETKTSHVVFSYNEASKLTLKKNINSVIDTQVVGAPQEVKIIRFKKIQKMINKFRLKTTYPTIYYVSHNIELNSGKYFPNTKNNIDLFNDELKIIEILGQVNKNSIFKSYPTKQYLVDREKYLKNKINKYKNIKYLNSEEDFRYSRSVSDIIITQSSQSTLGWCIGAKVPLVFLESKHYNSLVDDNVKKAFQESFFLFNYDKFGWEKELINFLNKPYDEILKLWNDKEKYRKKYDNIYFLSSQKDAGKTGAEYINKVILNL